ncbi:MAG: 3,4-dihydroxy-2-butanone-4-phosphate synthase, partial [Thermoplasmata archaeon]|nr:3,4-dihydroxy-2-butanone-4-phosphate synthase [Thermoplasmata archaeon]
GREEESDMVIASQFVGPEEVMRMRKDGGGLICTTVSSECQEKLDIPFMTELYAKAESVYPVLKKVFPDDIPYDEKSSFGLTVNHRKTFTGISDSDRAMTIKGFAELCDEIRTMNNGRAQDEFGKRFRSPGHVHLLNASRGLIDGRKGHTELSTALMVMAGLIPSATVCEMIGDNGHSTSKESALEYANEKGLLFIEGRDVIKAWKTWRAENG